MVQYLNSINSHIKFTVEQPNMEGAIPFLDTLTKPNGEEISVSVYRKPTHTDIFHWAIKKKVVLKCATLVWNKYSSRTYISGFWLIVEFSWVWNICDQTTSCVRISLKCNVDLRYVYTFDFWKWTIVQRHHSLINVFSVCKRKSVPFGRSYPRTWHSLGKRYLGYDIPRECHIPGYDITRECHIPGYDITSHMTRNVMS